MGAELTASDCPVCHSAGSVIEGRCHLCDAAFVEEPDGAVDLPPAAPSQPLRFSDVIQELQTVGTLVSSADRAIDLESACERLQTLLRALRDQFLTDVVLAETAMAPPGPRRSAT